MKKILHLLLCILVFTGCSVTTEKVEESQKTLNDFFLPMEPQAPLVSEGIWGAPGALPRDTANGLEDREVIDSETGKLRIDEWCYWDGSILKDDDGLYHMYATRWSQAESHSKGWTTNPQGTHAVSKHFMGPYVERGAIWPQWKNGWGCNVVGLKMFDGRYAVVTSETTRGEVFVSETPYGPFELEGELIIDNNGFNPALARYDELNWGACKGGVVGHTANVMILPRHDGRYMIIARYCAPMISENGILGPYKIMGEEAWRGLEGMPQFKNEDPTVWYSNGMYHIVVNFHPKDMSYHLTSRDGIHNWKNRGLAMAKHSDFFKYTDGTVNKWGSVQRPTVYVEDDEVKAFNFSTLDVHKGQDLANDNYGSKITVVPVDGKAFGEYFEKLVAEEDRISDATSPPHPWESADIGKLNKKGNTGFDELVNTFRVKATGNDLNGKEDAGRFVYKKMKGDISAMGMVMYQDLTMDAIKAGFSFRSGLGEGAKKVSATISNKEGLVFAQRAKENGNTEIQINEEIKAPYWIRFEKRKNTFTCYVSPGNNYDWTKVGETTLDLGEEFYVGMIASSMDNETLGLSRFKDVDIHQWNKSNVDRFIAHNFPDTIPAKGEIKFTVELETFTTSDISVELQHVHSARKLRPLRKYRVKSGIVELTYDPGEELKPGDMYWITIKLIEFHKHESEAYQACYKKVFVEK